MPILQFVHVVEGGEKAKMSKRAGDFVTLSELIERIGVDASRWFMLSRSHDSTIDLDLELAAKQDPENPVYYVQYAHARVVDLPPAPGRPGHGTRATRTMSDSTTPTASSSGGCWRSRARCARRSRAARRTASRGTRSSSAQAFSAFYRDSPVRDEPDDAVHAFRIALSVAVRRTLAAALTLLGVSAPHM